MGTPLRPKKAGKRVRRGKGEGDKVSLACLNLAPIPVYVEFLLGNPYVKSIFRKGNGESKRQKNGKKKIQCSLRKRFQYMHTSLLHLLGWLTY
uniref:Uncharacterized protein n=1 Tax=Rhizophora mucronata TaxID=61149 RepID=A0A2P2NE01_RHIMU